MRLTWTNVLPEQEEFRVQWNALVFQMEKPEVFYTWEWAFAVAHVYGGNAPPWIAVAYEGEVLVGVVALARSGASEAVFLAGTTADYCDFISLPEKRKEFVAQVLQASQEAGVSRLVLANLPADSATVAALRENQSFRSFLRIGYICAQVRLGSDEERRSLTDSLLSAKTFRRSMNALRRLGPVTLQHDRTAGLKPAVIDRFFAAHVARFLSMGKISNLVSKQRRQFLSELARLLSEHEWFDLMILRAGSWVLALNYGFRFRGSWFLYQPTIVNKFKELSPGYCLLAKVVEDAGRDPDARVVDLGLGAEGYKERFANAQRTTLHATLSRSSVELLRVRGRYHAGEAIKNRPRVESMVRDAQKVLRRNRQRISENGWASTLGWAGRWLQRSIASQDEVLLFQWPAQGEDPGPREGVVQLTWEMLAAAAMRYCDDSETMEYLLRSAGRFHSTDRPYALTGKDGIARHFAWVTAYEGFAMAELNEILRAPSENSVMIFDCWTPRELRGQGLYTRMIGELARMVSATGKDVWIFSAKANPASRSGIEKAGFQLRSSLLRRKLLWWAKTRQEVRGVAARERLERPSKESVA